MPEYDLAIYPFPPPMKEEVEATYLAVFVPKYLNFEFSRPIRPNIPSILDKGAKIAVRLDDPVETAICLDILGNDFEVDTKVEPTDLPEWYLLTSPRHSDPHLGFFSCATNVLPPPSEPEPEVIWYSDAFRDFGKGPTPEFIKYYEMARGFVFPMLRVNVYEAIGDASVYRKKLSYDLEIDMAFSQIESHTPEEYYKLANYVCSTLSVDLEPEHLRMLAKGYRKNVIADEWAKWGLRINNYKKGDDI